MAVRSFHKRNGDQFSMYLPRKMVEELGWKEQDRLTAIVEGRTIVFYKDDKLPTKLKICNDAYLVSLPIVPPKNTRGKVNVKQIGETIVVKFL